MTTIGDNHIPYTYVRVYQVKYYKSLSNIPVMNGQFIKHSRLQKEVLRLYRSMLKACKQRPGARTLIKQEFRNNCQIERHNIMYIEYLLRRGRRQLQLLSQTHLDDITTIK